MSGGQDWAASQIDSTRRGFTVWLPVPPVACHPNTRCHWAQRAKGTKWARGRAYYLAAPHAPPVPFERALVSADWRLRSPRDADGLWSWVKAYLDGFQDAGIVRNDNAFELGPLTRDISRKRPLIECGVWLAVMEL